MATPTTSGTVSSFKSSGINDLDALLNGDGLRWGTGSGQTTISFSFPGKNAAWMSQYGPEVTSANFAPIPASQQEALRNALASLSDVANIVFQEISETASSVGDIRIAYSYAVGEDTWGYSSYPNSDSSYADIWINRKTVLDAGATYTAGDYDYASIIHELGHSLGLKHPGNYNAGGGGAETPYITPSLDQTNFTIMSYTDPIWFDANGKDIIPQTPGVYDIRALQYLYGVNTTTNAGNTTYTYTPDNLVGVSIWDAGGTDTLDASAFSAGVQIDLQEGHYSDIGLAENVGIAFDAVIENAKGGSGDDTLIGNTVANSLAGGAGKDKFVFMATPAPSNIDTIADFVSGTDKLFLGSTVFTALSVGADIAGAFVSSAAAAALDVDDRLLYNTTTGALYYDADGTGSGAAVQLALLVNAPALAATDIEIAGTGGSDDQTDTVLYDGEYQYGDDGKDIFSGSDANDEIYGWGGNDQLGGGNGDDYIDGGDDNDKIDGGDGSDIIWGGDGKDSITGGLGEDQIIAEAGNDSIDSGDGNDYVDGDYGNDTIEGGNGDDQLYGYAGNDKLFGGAGDDEIVGEDGADLLYGNDGDDYLDGDRGADKMLGGSGDDVYYVDNKGDKVTETADDGMDSVVSSISYTLGDNVEDLILYSDFKSLSGTGNSLANYLAGDYEKDSLDGKEGNDTLEGGDGADVFIVSTTPSASTNSDIINDFIYGEDLIRLSKKIFTGVASGTVTASNFRSFDSSKDAPADANVGVERFIYDLATGELYFDSDGSGTIAAVKFLTLIGLPELKADGLVIY